MAITLRNDKGSALTYTELDGNFTDLNGRVTTNTNNISTNTTNITTNATNITNLQGSRVTTSSFNAFTGSVATTSSFNTFTSSVTTTSSFNTFTASAVTTSSFNTFTSSVVTTSSFNTFTSSVVTTSSFNSFTASVITTGSSTAKQSITGSLTVSSSLKIIGKAEITGSTFSTVYLGTSPFGGVGPALDGNYGSTSDIYNQLTTKVPAFPFMFDNSDRALGSNTVFGVQYDYKDICIGYPSLDDTGFNKLSPVIYFSKDPASTAPYPKYMTIVSDNTSVTIDTVNAGIYTKNGRNHVLTVTGSILSLDGVSLGSTVNDRHIVTGSLRLTGSAYLSGLVTASAPITTPNVLVVSSSGQVFVTASSAFGGGGTSDPSYLIYSGSVTASVNVNSASFQITSGSSTFMFISNSGAFGIGTSQPTGALHVVVGGGTEFQVQSTGTKIGNANSDAHSITGSLSVSGSNMGVNVTASSDWNLDVLGLTGKFRVQNSSQGDIFTVRVGSGATGYSDMYMNGQAYGIALYANPNSGNGYIVPQPVGSPGVTNNAVYSTGSTGLLAVGNSSPLVLGTQGTEKMRIYLTGDVSIGTQDQHITASGYKLNVTGSGVSGSLNVNNTIIVSGSRRNTRIQNSGTDTLRVIGSGSTSPIFSVQGSQGELFSVTDSLSGSLFSVNDISGLPILDVNSDQTTKIGSYLAPGLYASAKVTANTGVTVVYSIPTASYDSAYFDYNIRSGSVGRAGSIIAMWSGSSVNYNEVSASSFGTTNTFVLGVSISGSNMILSGSAPTNGWTVKTIIRSI